MKSLVCTLLLLTLMNEASAAGWEKLPPLPLTNSGFIGGVIRDEIVIAGGTRWEGDTKQWLDRIWVFNPTAQTWREAGRLSSALAYAAFGTTDGGLWFAGGSNGTETARTLSHLDTSLTVKTVAAIEPTLALCGSAVLGEELFVIGGANDAVNLDTASHRCYAIHLPDGKLRRLADLPAPAFVVGGTAACAGQIWVFGGAHWDTAAGEVRNMDTAFVYAPAEDRWTSLPAISSPNRGIHALTLDAKHILLAGGYKNDVVEFTNETFVFDTATRKYLPTVPLPQPGMVGLVNCGGFVYCLGGEDKKKHRTDACYRIRIDELLNAAK